MSGASTRIRSVTVQKPGSVGTLAGMSSAGVASMTTRFGFGPTGCVVVQVVGHVVLTMLSKPTISPSSVQGGVSGKFALQSRFTWTLWIVILVPFWIEPVPNDSIMSTVSPIGVTGGAPT